MGNGKARLAAAAIAVALAGGAQPAIAQGFGERTGGALNRGVQAVGRAAERAGSATGAAADRGLAWARRKARDAKDDGKRSSNRSRR
jgi:hypothetical protein